MALFLPLPLSPQSLPIAIIAPVLLWSLARYRRCREIIAKVEPIYGGGSPVELDRDDDLWIYEIKLVRAGGMLIKMKSDAAASGLASLLSKGAISNPAPDLVGRIDARPGGKDDLVLSKQLTDELCPRRVAVVESAIMASMAGSISVVEVYDAVVLGLEAAAVDGDRSTEAVARSRVHDAGADPHRLRNTPGTKKSRASTPAPTTTWPSPSRMELLARVRALIRGAAGHAICAEIRCGLVALDTQEAGGSPWMGTPWR